MVAVLTIPELVWIISSYLPSRTDVSSLSRCSKTLHGIVISVLYRDIEFSVFKVDSLAKSLKANASYSQYCRGLSVTLNGLPPSRQALAYRHTLVNDVSESNPTSVLDLRKRIRRDIRYVVHACLVHGNISQISWNLENDNSLSFEWLTDSVRDWKDILLSKGTLQSLQFTVARGVQSSLDAFDKLGTLSHQPFLALSRLVLHITIQRYQVQIVRRLLSSFPNVKLLDLGIYHLSRTDSSSLAQIPGGGRDTILPDTELKQLESLTICASMDSKLICLDDFIDKQRSLSELAVVNVEGHLSWLSSRLKAVTVASTFLALFGPLQAASLSSLSTIRIQFHFYSSNMTVEWPDECIAFINAIPQLKCIEIFLHLYNVFDSKYSGLYQIGRVQKDIQEIGIINHVFKKEGLNINTRGFCTYCNHLNTLLDYFSGLKTIRAFRLAFTGFGSDRQIEGLPKLPDCHTLDAAKIPQDLQYVLWEVPWMKKLYKVERSSDGSAKMLCTGFERLPGRKSSPDLTWTNESVFNHMEVGE